MKTKPLGPFIACIEHSDGRRQWAVYWRGEEYAKFNSLRLAELECDNLRAVDRNRHDQTGT